MMTLNLNNTIKREVKKAFAMTPIGLIYYEVKAVIETKKAIDALEELAAKAEEEIDKMDLENAVEAV